VAVVIFPIGDSPNPDGTPLVTYLLIGANVAVFLLTLPLGWRSPDPADPQLAEYVHLVARQTGYRLTVPEILANVSAYDMLVYRWGYRPADPSPIGLFTSMFLHGGLMHLVGNMLFLWIYGDNVEHRVGRGRFLLYYLGTGAAATLSHAMFFPTSGLPLVGASGAISGVLGFYFLWYPHNRVHILLLFPFLVRLSVPARTLLGLYIVVENVFPFVLARGASGVAYGAHIGGFVAGLAIAHFIDRRGLLEEPEEYGDGASGDVADVREAIAAGRFADAARAYFALPAEAARRPLNPSESVALGDWLLENGHPRGALVVYRRHLRDYPNGPGAAEAHLGAGLVQLRALDQPTTAYQHFLDALDHDPQPATAFAARQALQEIQARQPPLRPIRSAPGRC
jgi:membrane associated rhomboid family serine protease